MVCSHGTDGLALRPDLTPSANTTELLVPSQSPLHRRNRAEGRAYEKDTSFVREGTRDEGHRFL